MARIAVIGAGVGGLTSALLLARRGHEVTVYEKNDVVGGKLARTDIDGFHFDTGPSLLTLPSAFERLGLELDLVRLPHPFRYHFSDGSALDVFDDAASTRAAFEAFAPGAGREWQAMLERGSDIWRVAQRTFFDGPMFPISSLFLRFRSPFDLSDIDPMRTLAQRSERTFSDNRLQTWLNRYATYSGSSPWLAPATLACIPYIEQKFGCWHVMGGLASIADALAGAAKSAGAQIVLNADVQNIHSSNRRIRAINVNGERITCDAVVSNADAQYLYDSLYPDRSQLKKARRAGRSTSGFALLLALSGHTPNLTHHSVYFSDDQRKEFDQIVNGSGIADDPTVYVCCSSVTDAGQAPLTGGENWFVLVNTRAGAETDWAAYGTRLMDRLGIWGRVIAQRQITPADLEHKYRSPGGAIYGSSSNGRSAAFLRANNRGPVDGLYLVGGSSHPGGGLPLVVRSAEIVDGIMQRDGL